MTTPSIAPLHTADLSRLQSTALVGAGVILGRALVDPDGYVSDDDIATRLHELHATHDATHATHATHDATPDAPVSHLPKAV